MTSKKESEPDQQAVLEGKIADFHKRYSAMKLVPDEFIQLPELPISPALQFDDTDDEEPLPPLVKAKPIIESQKPSAPEPEESVKAKEPKKEPEPKKEDLGAAGFLLSGMVPSSSSKPGEQTEAVEKKKESQTTDDSDKSLLTEEQKLELQKQSEIPESESNSEAIPAQEKPVPELEPEKVQTDEESELKDVPKTKAQPEQTVEDEQESQGGKSGVFAKAKSLLATITKKDKK